MSYLSILNNEMQSIMVVLLFISTIFMTIAMLCEMFSNHKLKIDLCVVCRVLNIALCVIWAFVFFNFKNTPSCEILAYYSAVVLVFELALMMITKNWKLAIDFPFLLMLLPFWKYINQTFSVVIISISVVYLFAKSLALLLNSLSKLKNGINYYSLKEALDGLSTAIMFESKFNVVYENLAMKNLLEKLEINNKQSSLEIWKKLKSRKHSQVVDEQSIIIFLGEKIFSFSMINQPKIQIYAFDITKEYQTTIEIENKQAQLKEKQTKILQMIENIDEIEKQRQVLLLKSKLHDVIGQRLFIMHHVLSAIDEKNFNLKNIKKMLAAMLDEIDSDEISETPNMQSSIITAFDMIGFNIEILGEMPQDQQKAMALVKIIRECATNAIRHSNATKLLVEITSSRIEISDNGKFVEQSIKEGTGIKGMRLNAEMLGGQLSIFTENGFKVIIDL